MCEEIWFFLWDAECVITDNRYPSYVLIVLESRIKPTDLLGCNKTVNFAGISGMIP